MEVTKKEVKISSAEIRQRLKNQWPNLHQIWLFDENFWLPSREDLEHFVAQSKVNQMVYFPEVSDCDDFALQLYAEARRIRSVDAACGKVPKDEWVPWAIGRAVGTVIAGIKAVHAINICVILEQVLLIDPQKDTIWESNKSKNELFFIEM